MEVATITAFRAEYAKADEFCQEVQGFLNLAGVPAVNELRNAGHHFLNAVGDTGEITSDDDLRSAVNHARRACYEASEAGILAAIEVIRKFRDDYATVEVGSAIPKYAESLQVANHAMEMVEKGRTQGEDRTADHEARMSSFRTLRDFCKALDVGREEMNKKLAGATTLRRRFITTVSLAALGIVIAIVLKLWID